MAVLAILATFTSCKKDHTCTCTIIGIETSTVLEDLSKSDAEEACEQADASAQLVGGSCKLD